MLRALLDCLLISTAYVLPFYLQPRLPRFHPKVIIFRSFSTAIVCAFAWVPLFLAVSRHKGSDAEAVTGVLLRLLGLRWNGLGAAATLPVLLTAALFLGPLTIWAWDLHHGELASRPGRPAIQVLRDIFVGPLTEEFAFRSCMAPLLLLEGFSTARTILVTPLVFGLAHAHHLYEYIVHQGHSLGSALFAVAFQFAFTTVFGWFATFVFVRTGHLTAAVGVHAFCNLMGFPDFGALNSHPAKGVIRLAFVVGICMFCALIGPLTQPLLYANGVVEAGMGNAYLHTAQMHVKEGNRYD
ncbi:CAAX prenyl protease 2 [Coccomyxa sp. Obi]|nr:CAAX prenyl protease 2 [Coccomyxa sp. Obi]